MPTQSSTLPAVFVSYAREDAVAARRIAETLRAAGIEVWFDQNELVGGDAWDKKIRDQINACTLFVPIISANTQARTEGYFRLEWRLAEQRTFLMAKGRPFLLPIVIDDTAQAGAHVPEAFLDVQWSRFPEGQCDEKFALRVRQLLAWDGTAAVSAAREAAPATMASRKRVRHWGALAALLVIVVLAVWYDNREREKPAAPEQPAQLEITEVAQFKQRITAIFELYRDATEAEQKLALDLGAKLTALAPTDADAWAAYSLAVFSYSWVGNRELPTDLPSPLELAQRATALNADGFEPRFALASAYTMQRSTQEEAVALLQTLLKERPEDERVIVLLIPYYGLRDTAEALALADRAVARPHPSPYVWVLRAGVLMQLGRIDEAGAALQHSLEIKVTPSALMLQAYIAVFISDDLRTGAALVEKMPGSYQIREFETSAYGDLFLYLHEPTKALARYRAFRGDWMLGQPKAAKVGDALAMEGRPEAAAVSWRAALEQVETKLKAQPDDPNMQYWRAYLMANLGETTQAEAILPLLREVRVDKTSLASLLVKLGHLDEAIAALEQSWDAVFSRGMQAALSLRHILLHNPDYDLLRAEPRFQALIDKVRHDPRLPALK